MILLGLSVDPKSENPDFFDFVTSNPGKTEFDFIVDLTGIQFIKDPRPYLSKEYSGVYGDFVDAAGILRISTIFPYKYNAYPGMIIRKDVFIKHNGDVSKIIEEPNMFHYVPEALVRIKA